MEKTKRDFMVDNETAPHGGSGSAIPVPAPGASDPLWPGPALRFFAWAAVLTACFAGPLIHLTRYAMQDEFFSYIPLIPFISGYLIWIGRRGAPQRASRSWTGALIFLTAAATLLGVYYGVYNAGKDLEQTERLAFLTTAYLALVVSGAFFLLGTPCMRYLAFPAAFLAFMIPPAPMILDPVTDFMQTTSAWMAHAFLVVAGTPHTKTGLDIALSDIILNVAPECSGMHSTMVLLITSLLAGYLFLRSRWNRLWLALFVVPLAIVRNGFRIFVISELCVHIGAHMINSPIHHKGGPIFFTLSLVPFFLLLAGLRKWEMRGKMAPSPAKGLDK